MSLSSSPQWIVLVLAGLAVWRLTHLVALEDGPWRVLLRTRQFLGEGFWSELVRCFYCLSLWIALPISLWLGDSVGSRLLLWPALSAVAILIETLHRRLDPPSVVYLEDPKESE